MLELNEWDHKIKTHLDYISAGAEMIERHIDLLIGRPDFDTIAEHNVDLALLTLSTALRKVEKAKQELRNKPVVR